MDWGDHPRPIVIHAAEAPPPPGPPTPGMDRRQLVEDDDTWAGWVRTQPGAGGWHHHGERDSYIYLIKGVMTIEYGPGGGKRVTARAGDFIFNPRRMVHREITEGDAPAELFVVRRGIGPQNINVDQPDP